ncbi:MAG: NAD(P)/FAD-dependent oxidoreductase [Pseudomonadota bacterium]
MDKKVNTVVVGGGQAGLAMSRHLSLAGIPHVVLEKKRIAEAWRSFRWDALVANGPAWHDRFPDKEFDDTAPDGFAPKQSVADYLQAYARDFDLPVKTGVEVHRAVPNGAGYVVETSQGTIATDNIVVATGAFQVPLIPPVIPAEAPVRQLHSQQYRAPDQLDPGAVLVVGAGSSGAQIADELLRSGREVYLSIGPHERPPRAYRGHDYCHWLGVLGKWQMKTPPAGRAHVTISVSGARGGHTVDFREFAARGMTLLGMAGTYAGGVLSIQPDLRRNVEDGDDNHLGLLAEVDDYIAANGLDLPPEPEAKVIGPDPQCMTDPILQLDLAARGITTVVWATGYAQDFGWLQVDTFDQTGAPKHREGVGAAPGVYFLGLPWLTMRGSSFIWGVFVDAKALAGHIAARQPASADSL